MKKLFILFFLIHNGYSFTAAQTFPVALRPDISITQLLQVRGGATRISFNKTDSSLYYSCYNGKIFKVIKPPTGSVYDSLMYTTTDHGVQVVQGMAIFDSIIFVSASFIFLSLIIILLIAIHIIS